jgi:hypothetical protein
VEEAVKETGFPSGIVGPVAPPVELIQAIREPRALGERRGVATSRERGLLVESILGPDEVGHVHKALVDVAWVRANQNGFVAKDDEPTGSWRATWYGAQLAQALWSRVRLAIGEDEQEFDEAPGVLWAPVGLNHACRLIRYESGGVVWPHYDAPYVASAHVRSFLSVVLYLTDTVGDGATQFLKDPEGDPEFADWDRVGRLDEVLSAVQAHAGDALIFPHRILHEAPATREDKLILRTDVMFGAVGR